ncbi:anti-sigma factor antagonist [Spirochaetia bacterium]|nr:anti-sigma factor antagonist [Spirochaetia bacterium]
MTNNGIISGFDDEKDENLKIELQKIEDPEDCLVLSLNGYIDTYNSNYFQKKLAKVIESGFIRLIFHCGGLNYVSSAGIGSFTASLKSVKPRGGDLVLLEIQPKVYEVFQLLGFSQFFNISDNMEDALNFFRGGSSADSEALFPKVFICPVCSGKLKALQAGRFRCSECKSILAVDNAGQVFLG